MYAKGRKTHPMISEIEQNVNLFKMQGIAGVEREYNWKKEMIQIQTEDKC